MKRTTSTKRHLLCCTALALLMATSAQAQTAAQSGANTDEIWLTRLGRIVFGVGADRVAIDVPQAVTVLNEEDIDRAQADTVGDVIEAVPGVSLVGSESPFGESFNIRGIGGGASADEPRIVMQIDGVGKYYEQYRLGSLFSEPEFFQRVEVLRGPASSTLYGAGALAGVIAMETRTAEDILEDGDDFAVRQRLQYSDNGSAPLSTTIIAVRPNEQFSALAGFSYRQSDQIETGGGRPIPGTEGTIRSGIINGTYRFGESLEHSIQGGYFTTRSFVNDQVYNLVDGTSSWGTVDRDFRDETAYLRYNYQNPENDLVDLEVQLSRSNTAVNMSDPRRIFLPVVNYAYDTTTLRAENSSVWSGEGWENYLTVGASIARQDRVADRLGGGSLSFHPAGETRTMSIYAQNEFIWQDRLTALFGGRIDRQIVRGIGSPVATDLTGHAATFGLHYQFTDEFAMFGSASYTERLPTIDELFDTRVHPTPALGTLRPEQSVNLELGVAFDYQDVFTGGDRLTFKGLVFDNHMSDQIVPNRANLPVGGITPSYINLAETRIRGLEIEAAYETERFFSTLAYTHMQGRNIGDPRSVNPNLENQIPADTVTLGLGFRSASQEWEFGINSTWAASAQRFFRSRGRVVAVNTPSYFVHDLYAAYRPQSGWLGGSELRFGVENVADLDYRTHLQSTGTGRAGRTFTMTLSRTF